MKEVGKTEPPVYLSIINLLSVDGVVYTSLLPWNKSFYYLQNGFEFLHETLLLWKKNI